MKTPICNLLVIIAALLVSSCGSGPAQTPTTATPVAAQPAPPAAPAYTYPKARRGDQVDDHHGTRVADPYRWLEDPDAAETRTWIAAQNKLTQGVLGSIPARERIRSRLSKLWNYERFGTPRQVKGRYFYFKNDGLQNQSVLYIADSLDGKPRVLLDPNTLSEDGTTALKHSKLNKKGSLLAYQVSKAGSDWVEIRVRDVKTGKDLEDRVRWVKFSGISWARNGKGFYYSRYDAPEQKTALRKANYFHKLYFHKVGTDQDKDVLVYERKDQKKWGYGGTVTDDGRYLIIHVWRGAESKNQIFIKDLKRKRAKLVELIQGFANEFDFVGSQGKRFWFKTDDSAPRGRLVEINLRKPERKHWKEVIGQRDETLRSVQLVGDRFVASYLKDARSAVMLFDTRGKLEKELPLPALGSVWGFSGDRKDKETFYLFTSFLYPTTIYRYDFKTGESSVFRQPKVAFDTSNYVTRQVFYKSKDGTRVPMFLVHRKGLKMDGNNPVYMHAYGGFNISLTPSFKVRRLAWLEMGGIYAQPNLRGGGEYGEAWHKAGMMGNKQNVFDDFIAAAQWLVKEGYTRAEKLAIGGGSNGGLLVGACMTQRPELYGAVLAAVGVMDMLRFHKWTIGWAWVPEYGTADKAADFKWLHAYSPYHNLKPNKYPATMVTTADHDDRVVPAHSFKFAAQLQQSQKGAAPTIIRIETKAGHGAGKPTSKRIEEAADRWAFLVKALGVQSAKAVNAKKKAETSH